MLWLALGALTLFLFLGGLRAFERASVTSIKALLVWVGILGTLSLVLLLVLTGRGGVAIGAATLFGPLLYNRWRAARLGRASGGIGAGAQSAGGSTAGANAHAGNGRTGRGGSAARPRSETMTRQEAYEVLGLAPGATENDIRAAHHRLMRTAHPDAGGSDWLAARVNMARDILLGRRAA